MQYYLIQHEEGSSKNTFVSRGVTSGVLTGKQEKTSLGRRAITIAAAVIVIVSLAFLDHRRAHILGRGKLRDYVVHMIFHPTR